MMRAIFRAGRWPLLAGAVLVPAVALAGAGAHAWRMRTAPESEGELRERLDVGAQRLYGWSEATLEQQAKIEVILDDVAGNLWSRQDEREARRAEIRAILTADTVDRNALEGVRRDVVVSFDNMSREVVGYVADIAEILTAEQRRALVQRHDEVRGLE